MASTLVDFDRLGVSPGIARHVSWLPGAVSECPGTLPGCFGATSGAPPRGSRCSRDAPEAPGPPRDRFSSNFGSIIGAPESLPEPFQGRFLCSFALRFSLGFEENAGEAHDGEDHAGEAHHGEDHDRECNATIEKIM